MLSVLRENYLPTAVISVRKSSEAGLGYKKLGGKATAYVCRDKTCMSPTNEIEKILQFLGISGVDKK